jgi:nucleotide-binding universal stress UspA family protein
MAVGMIDDAIAWIILSVVLALITEGTVSPAIFVLETAKILLFISVTFFAGRLVIARVFNNLLDRSSLPEKSLTLVVFSVLAFSALAQSLRIEAVLGSFLAGIIFGTFRRLPPETIQKLHGLTVGIFAPIFFAIAGLKVDLYALFNPEIAMVALIVLAVASIGKLAGAFIGARLAGKDNWHAFAFGSALNARGAVQIVIASIGLQTGILAPEMYTIIVIVAITTSVMAPFMLRYASTRLKTDDEELQRLKREQWANESPVSAFKRILMPVRLRFEGSGQTQRVAAAVINRLSNKSKLDLTLLSVTTKEFELQCQRALLTMQPMFKNPAVSSKVVISSRPAEAILDEAQRDYDVMVLGATERASSQQTSLFNPMVDYLVRTAPASTIVVQASNVELSWQPNRILVPVSGTAASRNAVDMALNLAEGPDFEIIFVHVIQEEHVESPAGNRRSFVLQEEHIGQQILQDVKKRADALRIKNTTMLRSGPSVEITVLDVAAKNGIDLIVIGTSIRPGTDRLFLGPRVERMLYMAKCPVLIFNN